MDLYLGAKVSLTSPLQYLKTNDPMPVLRPPDLVSIDELGEIVGLNPMKSAEVRFRRGTFVIPFSNLSLQDSENAQA